MADAEERSSLERFVARARVALAVLVAFVAVAVHAPFLANGEPLRLVGVDRGALESARRGLAPATRDLARLVAEGEAGWRARNATRPFEEQLARERAALARGLRLLAAHADAPARTRIAAFEDEVARFLALASARAAAESGATSGDERSGTTSVASSEGDSAPGSTSSNAAQSDAPITSDAASVRDAATPGDAAAMREAAAARDAAITRDTATEREARIARDPAAAPDPATARDALIASARALSAALDPDAPGAAVPRAITLWPAFAKLAFVDVSLLAIFWLAPLAWCVRAHRKLALAGAFALALALSAWFESSRESRLGTHARPAKEAFAAGDLDVASAWFAPIAMGFDETHLDEASRAPTWSAASQMTPEGRYVRGARARASENELGFAPVATPVVPRLGEPALNAWNRHLLGTDSLGRDLCARLAWGTRTSLAVGVLAAGLASLLGVVMGALAGYFGGLVDGFVSRAIETTIAFPAFFLVLCALAFVDRDAVSPLVAVAVVIGLVNWTSAARLVRAEVLRLRELEFVASARSLGLREARILAVHVLPNALPPALVAAAFSVATAILSESALAFLGFGVQIPTPSWGAAMGDAVAPETWWTWLFPGLVLVAAVASFHAIAEALRAAFDPAEGVDG